MKYTPQLILLGLLFITSASLQAHPGRTASDGYHYCRTNCDKWGEVAGQRHGHGQPKAKLETQTEAARTTASCKYSRKSWQYKSRLSPYADATVGFYTNIKARATDVDHVVALSDASRSGGCTWSSAKKKKFGNDSENHVPSIPHVNQALKNNYPPKKFIANMNKLNDQYEFAPKRKCQYVTIYYNIKTKYNLSFAENDPATFKDCGLTLPKK